MTCPDVEADPMMTHSEAHSVPAVYPCSKLLKTDGTIGCILYCSKNCYGKLNSNTSISCPLEGYTTLTFTAYTETSELFHFHVWTFS